jgi:hypothetical protein
MSKLSLLNNILQTTSYGPLIQTFLCSLSVSTYQGCSKQILIGQVIEGVVPIHVFFAGEYVPTKVAISSLQGSVNPVGVELLRM